MCTPIWIVLEAVTWIQWSKLRKLNSQSARVANLRVSTIIIVKPDLLFSDHEYELLAAEEGDDAEDDEDGPKDLFDEQMDALQADQISDNAIETLMDELKGNFIWNKGSARIWTE